MNAAVVEPAPVTTFDQHLHAGSDRPNFEVDDVADLAKLRLFPRLHDAVAWLDTNVTPLWRDADSAAINHQIRHQLLARTAVITGAGAIILAVVQLALKQSWPELNATAGAIEAITVLAGFISVGVGILAKSDRQWLGCHHRSERLRMLKFKALARAELWKGPDDQWKSWVEKEIACLPAPHDLQQLEQWSKQDRSEAGAPSSRKLKTSLAERAALSTYYRHKRLLNQADYFDRKGTVAAESWPVRMRQHREQIFFVTIGCVLFHFAADFVAGRMEDRHALEAARGWELASLWGVVLAAVLPVTGIGVRALSAAFELSRKARSFEAKHQAMNKAADRLGDGTAELPLILAHMQHDELFLEQEHREWLRLLLDAEWFL